MKKLANETIEVDGVKWLVIEAVSYEEALNAVAHARCLGSTGATMSETVNNVNRVMANVTRNGAV